MALARLESADFEKILPKNAMVGSNRSLLLRLNTLQQSLKFKQKSGTVPIYNNDDKIDNNSSVQSSIIEEDSEEASGHKDSRNSVSHGQ